MKKMKEPILEGIRKSINKKEFEDIKQKRKLEEFKQKWNLKQL